MKKTVKSFMLLLVFLMAMLALTACGKTEIPFNDYVSLDYEGYDGKATAEIDFDASGLMKDYQEDLSEDNVAKLAKQFRKIELSADKNSNLSNGDVVKVSWKEIDAEAFKELGIIPIYSDVEFTVENLEQLKEMDLFKGIEYTIEGHEGYTRTYISSRPEHYYDYEYSLNLENGDQLKNGDNVVITATISDSELERMAEDGYKPASLKYESKAENINPVTVVNPFDYVTPTFYGTAPDGTIYLLWNDGVEDNIRYCFHFEYDKESGLSNGDKVKVSIADNEDDDLSDRIRIYGYCPSVTEQEYEVTGLRSNLVSINLISEENLDEFKTSNIENMQKDISYSWPDTTGIRDIAYCGSIITHEKNNEDANNNLYLIYKIDLDNEYDGAMQVYWYSRYKEVMAKGDGTTNAYIPGERTPKDNYKYSDSDGLSGEAFYGSTGVYYYVGFESLESLMASFAETEDIVENTAVDVEMKRVPKTSFIARVDFCNDNGYVYDFPEMSGSVEITEDGTYTVTTGDQRLHHAQEALNFGRIGVKILGIGESNDISGIKISNISITVGTYGSEQEYKKVKAVKKFIEDYPGNANNMAFYAYYGKDVDGDGKNEVTVIEPKSSSNSISVTFTISGITSKPGEPGQVPDAEQAGTEEGGEAAEQTGTEEGGETAEQTGVEEGGDVAEQTGTEEGGEVAEQVGKADNDEIDASATYDVRLISFGDSKLKIISKIRALTGLGLADAKNLVESAPVVVLENMDSESAANAKSSLEADGALVELIKK